MDVDAYLARIDHARRAEPTLEALRGLQAAHLLAVPFENLDIVFGRPISLDPQALFDKVVMRRRGGYCYELNGLFALLLEALGYRVSRLSGRTVEGVHGELGPEFDHLVLRVDLDEGPYLVDVGFGESVRDPMALQPGADHRDTVGRTYRLEVAEDGWDLRERLEPDDEAFDVVAELSPGQPWRTQFRFRLEPHPLAAFEATSRWQQTESEFFTRHRFCTLATVGGRRTLMDDRFTVRTADGRTERPVSDDEVPTLLEREFGIVL